MVRWLFYVLVVFACAWLATPVYYFAQIAIWNVVNPQSTAFMRSDAWRIVSIQVSSAPIAKGGAKEGARESPDAASAGSRGCRVRSGCG